MKKKRKSIEVEANVEVTVVPGVSILEVKEVIKILMHFNPKKKILMRQDNGCISFIFEGWSKN